MAFVIPVVAGTWNSSMGLHCTMSWRSKHWKNWSQVYQFARTSPSKIAVVIFNLLYFLFVELRQYTHDVCYTYCGILAKTRSEPMQINHANIFSLESFAPLKEDSAVLTNKTSGVINNLFCYSLVHVWGCILKGDCQSGWEYRHVSEIASRLVLFHADTEVFQLHTSKIHVPSSQRRCWQPLHWPTGTRIVSSPGKRG